MSYFPDLTPYEYRRSAEPYTVNIGWLSASETFPTGVTSDDFRDRLFHHCTDDYIVNIARGFHACEICGLPSERWYADNKLRYGPKRTWASIGDGEIRIPGEKRVYAAPALIYHYVVEHGYRPPDEFTEAVLACPAPGSTEHLEFLKRVRDESKKQAHLEIQRVIAAVKAKDAQPDHSTERGRATPFPDSDVSDRPRR